MKKIIALVLVLCMVLGLAACGTQPSNNAAQNNTVNADTNANEDPNTNNEANNNEADNDAELTATAKTGVYVGHRIEGNVIEYLGIPYAKTPERWKKAEKLDPGSEVFVAAEDGPACPAFIAVEEFSTEPPQSEDCLFLNIWTSSNEGKKPVYVWIHGGSYHTGSARTDCYGGIYCGDRFVANNPDIVYVNINYRLGMLGSIDLSKVDTKGEYPDSKNLQILDCIRALEWVHENIAAFGGDPDHVTIGGQSAGAYTTHILTAIPEARQYFQAIIAESTAPSNNTMKEAKMAEMAADAFFEFSGADTLDKLLALTPDEIVEAGNRVKFEVAPFAFEPCRDDVLIPIDIEKGMKEGAKNLKVLSGTVAGEFSTDQMPLSDDELKDLLMEIYGYPGGLTEEDVQAYLNNYPNDRTIHEALEDIHNDCGLRAAQVVSAECFAEGGADVWLYYINYKPEGAKVRAQHCFEIPMIAYKEEMGTQLYLVGDSGEPLLGKTVDPVLSKRIQATWSSFIRNWDPNNKEIGSDWPTYSAEDKHTMVIDKEWTLTDEVRSKDLDIARRFT